MQLSSTASSTADPCRNKMQRTRAIISVQKFAILTILIEIFMQPQFLGVLPSAHAAGIYLATCCAICGYYVINTDTTSLNYSYEIWMS